MWKMDFSLDVRHFDVKEVYKKSTDLTSVSDPRVT